MLIILSRREEKEREKKSKTKEASRVQKRNSPKTVKHKPLVVSPLKAQNTDLRYVFENRLPQEHHFKFTSAEVKYIQGTEKKKILREKIKEFGFHLAFASWCIQQVEE